MGPLTPVKIDGKPTNGGPQFQCIRPGCRSIWFVQCFRLQYTKDMSFVQRIKLLFPYSDRVTDKWWACAKCGSVIGDSSIYGSGSTFELGKRKQDG